MTQQIDTEAVVSDKQIHRAKADAGGRLNMVRGIRQEIVVMLASKKRGLSADDYQILGREGILHEDDRVELLDGEIVVMSPIGSRHAACVNMLSSEFSRMAGENSVVSIQNPTRLGYDTEPKPDIALLRPRDDFYADAHPSAEDILLLIEVADSSLRDDRDKTRNTYARHNVPEVWIANLPDELVERYGNLVDGEYRDVILLRRGDSVSSVLLPDVEVRVDDILP